MKTEYKTKDLYEAAYLVAKGLNLKRLERKPSSCCFFFVFENFSECKAAVVDFWNNRGVITPKSYAEAIRNLIDRLYSGV